MKSKKMVLFDWNGTLIDDTPIWYKSIGKIFELHDADPPSIEEYFKRLEQVKEYTEIYRGLGIDLSTEELDRIYQEEYKKHLETIELSPAAKEVLDILKKRRITLGIISVQLRSVFEPVFSRFGLKKYFKHVILEAQKKSVLIARLYLLEKIEPQNCYYIGDTPSDIRHAKNAGVKSVAYLTEYIPKEMLLANKPDFAISDLQELPKIIARKKRNEE